MTLQRFNLVMTVYCGLTFLIIFVNFGFEKVQMIANIMMMISKLRKEFIPMVESENFHDVIYTENMYLVKKLYVRGGVIHREMEVYFALLVDYSSQIQILHLLLTMDLATGIIRQHAFLSMKIVNVIEMPC